MKLARRVFCLGILSCTGSPGPDPDPGASPTGETAATAATGTTGVTGTTGATGTTGDTGADGPSDLTAERCLDDDGCDLDALLDRGQVTCDVAVRAVGGTGDEAQGIWTEVGGFTLGPSTIQWACISDELSTDHCVDVCTMAGFGEESFVPGFGCVCTSAEAPLGTAAADVAGPACDGPASDTNLKLGRQKSNGATSVQVTCDNGSAPISQENCEATRAQADLAFGTSLTRAILTDPGCFLDDFPVAP